MEQVKKYIDEMNELSLLMSDISLSQEELKELNYRYKSFKIIVTHIQNQENNNILDDVNYIEDRLSLFPNNPLIQAILNVCKYVKDKSFSEC